MTGDALEPALDARHIYEALAQDGALTSVPIYQTHKRGRNWLAVIKPDPRAPSGLGRAFIARGHGPYYYLTADLAPGQAIEFGADYYSGGGNPHRQRWYGVVLEVADDHVTIESHPTARDAIARAKSLREGGGPP